MPEILTQSSDREFERIPEHSLSLMLPMSGGNSLRIGAYLFFYANHWLMAIAYPLKGPYSHDEFLHALNEAIGRTSATEIYAIGSDLPPEYAPNIIERDRYYILSANAQTPKRLRTSIKKAELRLSIKEGIEFTPAHRRLFSEFLENSPGMEPRVTELYLRTPEAMRSSTLHLLDAIDKNGNIVASLLLDYSPAHFISYIIGAHSKKNYIPHATDFLFSEMLKRAQKANKRYIHLGLGINEGILRFKRKWGAVPYYNYVYAQWTRNEYLKTDTQDLLLGLLRQGASKRKIIQSLPSRKPFAMLWEVRKNNAISWIGGTAHFFCHSFEHSFTDLFKKVDSVIFEGPLDHGFMEEVEKAGKLLPSDYTPLLSRLSEKEISNLEKIVWGPRGSLPAVLGMERKEFLDVRNVLATSLPWNAFFTLWTNFLERIGWHESVDMEAWRIANEMGKNVIGMENLEEQLASLGSLPVERVLRFFRNCGSWKKLARKNARAYLAGDLEGMMGSSAEFPTRTEHVIGRRDQRFRERMRPWLEKGRTAVFVGSAHMVNLRNMLLEDGFLITQKPFGLWPKIHYVWRNFSRPDNKVKW